MKGKNAIFSGRFDPVHIGHILTILKLLDTYPKVVVVILNYKNRTLLSNDVKYIIDTIFKHNTKGVVYTIVNEIHFGKITEKEYLSLLYRLNLNVNETVYVSGNMEVLKNFKEMNVRYSFISRSGDFSGTEIRDKVSDVYEYYKN